MREAQIPVRVYCSNQQGDEIREFIPSENFSNLPGTENRHSLVSPREVPKWFATAFVALLRLPRSPKTRLFWFVHGDTMTALLGTVAASIRREHVAHIEAGLRSASFTSPFPEELIRRLIGRCANTHFAPSRIAEKNLRYLIRRRKYEVIVTNGNTVVDALPTAVSDEVDRVGPMSVIVVLHRSEFLARADLVRSTFLVLGSYATAKGRTVGVIADALALQRFRGMGLVSHVGSDVLQYGEGSAAGVTFFPKMRHTAFLEALRGADVVVTDSGGVQEETAALGIPCLIFRDRTERVDGLGDGAELVGMDPRRLSEALRKERERRTPRMRTESPSDVIVKWMTEQQ